MSHGPPDICCLGKVGWWFAVTRQELMHETCPTGLESITHVPLKLTATWSYPTSFHCFRIPKVRPHNVSEVGIIFGGRVPCSVGALGSNVKTSRRPDEAKRAQAGEELLELRQWLSDRLKPVGNRCPQKVLICCDCCLCFSVGFKGQSITTGHVVILSRQLKQMEGKFLRTSLALQVLRSRPGILLLDTLTCQ